MTPTELTKSIVAVRNELSEAKRRHPDTIYRRLPKAAQDEWDELGMVQAWLIAIPRNLLTAITRRVRQINAEGGEL
jgi:hypothetical protein